MDTLGFIRFSYVGDAAPPLRPILLLAILTVFLYFSQRNNRRLGDIIYFEILNHHSDRQLIVYSTYAYKSLSLAHVFVSALSTSDIRPLLHLLAH